MLARFDDAVDRARTAMLVAGARAESWVDRVRAALFALLSFLDQDPDRARLLLLGSLAGDAQIRVRRARLLHELADALERGRPAPVADALGAPFGPDALVAGVASILQARVLEDPPPPLGQLGGSLMAMIVLPQLGVDAARAELVRGARDAS
ncbi:MAG TPA: hypothetical protein VGY13_06850 [Solirubrobacteraceae bacterium]|nr:hypothetical protein [Solirubrobacteraceae bacterium]